MTEKVVKQTLPNGATARMVEASGIGERGILDDYHIDGETVRQAEKLATLRYTDSERTQVLELLPGILEKAEKRRTLELGNATGPATRFTPHLQAAGADSGKKLTVKIRSTGNPRWNYIRSDEDYIAFAPVWVLAQWIRRREISSRRLTEIYLERLKRYDMRLSCVITLTEERAYEMADRADREIRSGTYRGVLHGIPWGAKDLLDTKGIRTTYGANPYRLRIPSEDAAVVKRLDDAGAVLVAKLALGALAYGDVWFAGKTKNPWNLREGASGSSAGSAAAMAAGLVGFSVGSETYGSIVSPCMKCGVTGLRPTFGRVSRTGSMSLAWSFDKIGPIARCVEDAATVLAYMSGSDPGDPDSVDEPFAFDVEEGVKGMKVGFDPAWFEGSQATDVDRLALRTLRETDVELVEVHLPDLPYEALTVLIDVEAAAAFEELTLSNRDDLLVRQDKDAWPNIFRAARLVPAVEYIQLQRLRRKVMEAMDAVYRKVDVLVSPAYAADLLLITNATGHPALVMPAGFTEEGKPYGITLWGRLFDEASLCRLGITLERRFGMWNRYPPLR